MASANRDERRYEDGERFDLFRPRLPVASFGYGAHFCSGHFIARELERIALEEIFAQLPNLRLDPDAPPLVRGFGVRGVKKLPIVWDADHHAADLDIGDGASLHYAERRDPPCGPVEGPQAPWAFTVKGCRGR